MKKKAICVGCEKDVTIGKKMLKVEGLQKINGAWTHLVVCEGCEAK